MSDLIPEKYHDLLERPIVVTLATQMPDGQPQVTPVWFSWDGAHIWVNTARGRQKDKNLTERPKATVLILDPDNVYRWLEIRGDVLEINEEEGLEHINSLSARYRDIQDYYAANPSMRGKEQRVVYKIKPSRVNYSG